MSMDGNLAALNAYLDREAELTGEWEEAEEQFADESLEESFDPDTDGNKVTHFGMEEA